MLAGGSAHHLLGDDQNSDTNTQAAHCNLYSISCIHVEKLLSHAETYAKYINKLGKLVNPNSLNSITIHSTIQHHSCTMRHYNKVEDVVLILIGLNYENLESNRGVNGESSEEESSQPSFLPLLNPETNGGYPVPRNLKSENNELLTPPVLCFYLHPVMLPLSPSPNKGNKGLSHDHLALYVF